MASWANLRTHIDPYVGSPMNRVYASSEPIFPTTDYERFINWEIQNYQFSRPNRPIYNAQPDATTSPAKEFLMSVGTIVLVISFFLV